MFICSRHKEKEFTVDNTSRNFIKEVGGDSFIIESVRGTEKNNFFGKCYYPYILSLFILG